MNKRNHRNLLNMFLYVMQCNLLTLYFCLYFPIYSWIKQEAHKGTICGGFFKFVNSIHADKNVPVL